MFGPLLLILLLLLSRSCCFDNWTWPNGLIAIFVMNFLAATACWWVVRHAADNVRKSALRRLNAIIQVVKHSEQSTFKIPAPGGIDALQFIDLPKDDYLSNLKKIHKRIVNERRGAFARWFQDPTYMAVCIPSGISGIVSLIGSFWLSK